MTEWEEFLEGIVSSPRPLPVERHGLAVDASDFSPRFRQCDSLAGDGEVADGRGNRNRDIAVPSFDGGDGGSGVDFNASDPDRLQDCDGANLHEARHGIEGLHFVGGVHEGRHGGGDVYSKDLLSSRDETLREAAKAGIDTDPTLVVMRGEVGTNSKEVSHSSAALGRPEVLGDSDGAILADSTAKENRELIYAIEVSVAPAYVGGEPMRLSAEVIENVKGEARR